MNDYICYRCNTLINLNFSVGFTTCQCRQSYLSSKNPDNICYKITVNNDIAIYIYPSTNTTCMLVNLISYNFDFIFTKEYLDVLHRNPDSIINYI